MQETLAFDVFMMKHKGVMQEKIYLSSKSRKNLESQGDRFIDSSFN